MHTIDIINVACNCNFHCPYSLIDNLNFTSQLRLKFLNKNNLVRNRNCLGNNDITGRIQKRTGCTMNTMLVCVFIANDIVLGTRSGCASRAELWLAPMRSILCRPRGEAPPIESRTTSAEEKNCSERFLRKHLHKATLQWLFDFHCYWKKQFHFNACSPHKHQQTLLFAFTTYNWAK